MSNLRLTQKVTQLLGTDDQYPAQSATEPYSIAQVDDDGSTATANYYGFVRGDGGWYIMRETKSGNVSTFEYYKAASDFSTGWTNRTSHTYVSFDSAF